MANKIILEGMINVKTIKKVKLLVVLALVISITLIPLAALAADVDTLPQEVRFYITAFANPTYGGTVSGGGYFYTGEEVVLQAIPYLGYKFAGWHGQYYDIEGSEEVLRLYAYQDMNIEARFVRDYSNVTPVTPTVPPAPPVTPVPTPITPTAPSGAPPAPGTIGVIIGNSWVQYDIPPQVINGRTLVPLRATFEALGAYVDWNEVTQTVIATRGGTVINLTIGQDYALVNGQRTQLDVPGMTQGGRTLVPLRFVGEALGANVDWNAETQIITITQAPVFH